MASSDDTATRPTGAAWPSPVSPAGHEFLDRYRDPVNALESRMLHGTTKPQVTALRRTLTTCHANLAPGQPRLP